MIFPDHAPSRFSVAFKAGTTRHLREQLAAAQEHGVADEPARAAERILVLMAGLNAHHRGTRGHSERVRAFNDLIAEELRLPQADRDRLRWAALLHDVGKLEVPARLLDKPGKPTQAEWETLRRHPEVGARMVAPLRAWLGPWAAAVEEHHERWDGGGYPRGMAGQEIGLAARIVAVADVFEVMTAPRAYRRPVNAEAARAELARCAGSQLDPVVVRAFLNVSLGKLRVAMGPLSWLAQIPFVGVLPRLEGVAAAGRAAATVAGTATGVGALALIGVVGPPTADGPAHVDTPAAQGVTGVPAVSRDPSGAPGPVRAGRPSIGIAPVPPPATQSPPSPGPARTGGSRARAGDPAAPTQVQKEKPKVKKAKKTAKKAKEAKRARAEKAKAKAKAKKAREDKKRAKDIRKAENKSKGKAKRQGGR